jgi:predicted phosphoribosyltransferase
MLREQPLNEMGEVNIKYNALINKLNQYNYDDDDIAQRIATREDAGNIKDWRTRLDRKQEIIDGLQDLTVLLVDRMKATGQKDIAEVLSVDLYPSKLNNGKY